MRKRLLVSALALATVSAGSVLADPAAREPLDSAALNSIRSQFTELMDLANRHDLKALHEMFWQSPSSLLVAKSAIPSDGNWGMATIRYKRAIWGQLTKGKKSYVKLHAGLITPPFSEA